MKILFNCKIPFALAHGGLQIQVEHTQAALQSLGLQVEPLRWWDHEQTGDVIHYFGRMPAIHAALARQKGIKIVMAELLTGQGSRSHSQLRLQKIIKRIMEHIAPRHFIASFSWESYQLADACVALTSWEAHLMRYLFDAPAENVHVVPNGVEDVFFQSPVAQRGKWLVCTATVTERKRVLELAEAAAGPRPRSGLSESLTPNPIVTRKISLRLRGSIQKSFAMKARFRIARDWLKFIAPPAGSCC